jgi:hypothetical protein
VLRSAPGAAGLRPAVAWAGSASRIFVAVVAMRRIVLLSGSV